MSSFMFEGSPLRPRRSGPLRVLIVARISSRRSSGAGMAGGCQKNLPDRCGEEPPRYCEARYNLTPHFTVWPFFMSIFKFKFSLASV